MCSQRKQQGDCHYHLGRVISDILVRVLDCVFATADAERGRRSVGVKDHGCHGAFFQSEIN
jgi:hypothetical protein